MVRSLGIELHNNLNIFSLNAWVEIERTVPKTYFILILIIGVISLILTTVTILLIFSIHKIRKGINAVSPDAYKSINETEEHAVDEEPVVTV